MRKFLNEWLQAIAALASIIGLIVVFIVDQWAALIALCAIIIFLSATLWKIYQVLNSFVAVRYPAGYSSVSTFIRYSTSDGNRLRYEVYKYIQCRQPLMTRFDYEFKWSGTHPPALASDFQRVGEITPGDVGGYDKVCLEFPTPLRYNQAALIHLAMNLDDADRKSEPFISTRVSEPLQLLQWRVELRHTGKGYKKTARVLKQRLDSKFSPRAVQIGTVPFDPVSKSFEYHISNPEPGYHYRLEWDR
ncbi:MAG TPA: hypothetical protein VGR37_24455 [Longimicrobiaceae bacterium]|nr:hypothetical protein [Longimicrobiaceae bacterium]